MSRLIWSENVQSSETVEFDPKEAQFSFRRDCLDKKSVKLGLIWNQLIFSKISYLILKKSALNLT